MEILQVPAANFGLALKGLIQCSVGPWNKISDTAYGRQQTFPDV